MRTHVREGYLSFLVLSDSNNKIYALQNEKAELRQERQALDLEWKHFCLNNDLDKDATVVRYTKSNHIIKLWLEYQMMDKDGTEEPTNWLLRLKMFLKNWWLNWNLKHRLNIKGRFNKSDLTPLVKELQRLYYINRKVEIDTRLEAILQELALYDTKTLAKLQSHPQISEYVSENLTYSLLQEVLPSDGRFACLKVLCHIPLRQVVKETTFMTVEEQKYASNYSTHLDFLIINVVSKQPVLAIETDGYSYHNEETEQHQRDMLKDHILATYGLPLLRLSTKGSNERDKVLGKLNAVCI